MPLPLIGYVLSVVGCYLRLFAWEAARTPARAADLALFGAPMCCGAVCVEATRRLGRPAGVSRDLPSAWWLPVALLLAPVYALAAPDANDSESRGTRNRRRGPRKQVEALCAEASRKGWLPVLTTR